MIQKTVDQHSRGIRQALKARTLTVGSWLQLASPAAAEIMANVGYQWLGLDCEHTSSSLATVENVCRAIRGRGPSLLVRISRCDTLEIRKALDVGADGVIVPMVETVEQARQAVAAAKYPPQGIRGYCFGRMNNWGIDFDEHAREANENAAVALMIESRKGVENVQAIAAAPGVDALFIGPYDMSGSYGVPGEVDHPAVVQGRQKVLEAARQAGISAGIHIVKPTEKNYRQALADGFTFVCLGGDVMFLNEAARQSFSFIQER